ncbi:MULTISPECIES: flagellar export chaperone FliS [Ralstonia solanacearum species complex]|uniref:Flagellar secretion chaperone FliS n=2 Tax=Ralstonia solanacearum species complex TaxID=3116862 RepID=A0AAD0S9H2_RALSL|nr:MULTISPECIES: flagellar export chaperone FliS [Ralstonia solanacearum species complex]BEU73939.1 flagellar export chaperone FliS [Ralstonia pseudosolanacearum]AMP39469.1 flagellar protein FliS [Ralstonia solanacearum]AXV78856.1 flagellar export chaperone FliS [Ralstonia solanacearum]AXV83516.1 flagellar export chaperone FliS [Ralstonia solanacearum]AXV88305.1 flagellar export chaperone FliS [Ralstonia solanacearum]
MYAAHRAIGAYSQVGIETSVVDANPHRLIAMLFEGARSAINLALAAMQRGDVLAKVRAFDKAISIIGQGLQASLDRQRGGEIAEQLDALYDYMLRRLLVANATNDVAILEEVDRLLMPLQEAWAEIGKPGVVAGHLSVVS